MFLNSLSADGKYPVDDLENLPFSIQMEWSEKRKTFSEFFLQFLESTSCFKHFEEKMMVIPNVFPNLQTVKILVRALSKNRSFRKRFDT